MVVGTSRKQLNRCKCDLYNMIFPSEDVWMEAPHACVFVLVLVGLRGGRRVLSKMSPMMFPADTVKDSHVLTRTEFM